MWTFLTGAIVAILLMIGAVAVYDVSYATKVSTAAMPGVHVSPDRKGAG